MWRRPRCRSGQAYCSGRCKVLKERARSSMPDVSGRDSPWIGPELRGSLPDTYSGAAGRADRRAPGFYSARVEPASAGSIDDPNESLDAADASADGACCPLDMVPGAGVEPARVLPHRILSPARLPVPPSRHGPAKLTSRTAVRKRFDRHRSSSVEPGGATCGSAGRGSVAGHSHGSAVRAGAQA